MNIFTKTAGYITLVTALIFIGLGYNQAVSKNKRTINKKVLLITIDGLQPNFYLDNKYDAPTLKSMREQGVYAEGVEVVFPSLTYPSHTTLITGTYPAQHQILSNTVFTWENGPSPAWYWEAEKIKSPTLYEYVQKAGGTTASVRWPVTLNAQHVNYLVPEIFNMKGFYEGDNFELTEKFTRPDLMKEILAHTTLKRYDDEVQMDTWAAEATAFLQSKKRPDFMTVHLANVDHIEHGTGRESAEVVAAVKQVDDQLRTILDSVDTNETCVIVTGDHGFFNVDKKISPNILFLQKGWITLNKKGGVDQFQVIAHASGAQAAIYIKNKKLLPEVQSLLAEHAPQGFTIITKDTLNKFNSYPQADLAIEGRPGFTISGSVNGQLVSSSGAVKGQHGYLPSHPELRTGLLMLGCGYPQGARWSLAHSIDIAPTIAKIMGIEAPTFVGKPLLFESR